MTQKQRRACVERALLPAAFDLACNHPTGVIPSAAVLQAERGISRASPAGCPISRVLSEKWEFPTVVFQNVA
jgi:hypothetical protein